jgi:hypothetical protein
MSLRYHKSLLLLHFLVLLAELRQIELHNVLDQVVQLILIMLQLGDVYYILFLEIGQEFFEVLQLLICEVHVDLCRFHLDILGDIGEDALLGVALLQYLGYDALAEGDILVSMMLFARKGWFVEIHLLLHRSLFGLCVIYGVLQGDALLLRSNLLLLLHLELLMNLLSELHVKFG